MGAILAIVIILLIAYKLYSFVFGKPQNSPPGLPRLPIWGSYWFLLWGNYNFPYKTMTYYVKKYKSKIVSLYMGSGYTIVVNDYEGVKEVLTRKEFDGRLSTGYVSKARAFGKKLGLFFNDDVDWLNQRRFALRYMRDFGFGRRYDKFESIVNGEIATLVDVLRNGATNEMEKMVAKDGLAYFPDVLFPSTANSIWFIMSGETYDRQDYEILRKLCRSGMRFQRGGDTSGGAVTLTPWLRYFGDGFGFNDVMKGSYGIVDFIKNFVNQRESLSDDDNRIDGFLDVYLKKLKEYENLEDNCEFSKEQMYIIVTDVMFPAISAVPTMITHCIKYVMHNPEVMKKVQREIDDVVGRSRLPDWNDRNKLVYTEATIRETLRIETLTPWSVAHRATKSTTLMGYDVPINTAVVTNLAGMHNDPEMWGDPENFRPERFLTEDGKSLGKDYTFPFGFGRRVCAGETFARFLLFAHFATLAQNFNFEFVKGQPTKIDDVIPGLIVTVKETWIRVIPR